MGFQVARGHEQRAKLRANRKSRSNMLSNVGILRMGRGSWAAMPILFLFSVTPPMAKAQMPGQKMPGPPPAQVEQTSQGIRATAGREVLEVTVCTASVI